MDRNWNSGLNELVVHVLRALCVHDGLIDKTNRSIGLSLHDHLPVSDRTCCSTVNIPCCGEFSYFDSPRVGPVSSQSVSTWCFSFDDQTNSLASIEVV